MRIDEYKTIKKIKKLSYRYRWLGILILMLGITIVFFVKIQPNTNSKPQLNNDTSVIADYWSKEPTILTAFFGLDNEMPRLAPNICRGSKDKDGIPVIFSHPIDVDTLDPEDFEFTSKAGMKSTPICALLSPAIDDGENRTALLIGEFGTAPDDEPFEVKVIGELKSLTSTGTVNFNGASQEVIPLINGPEIITAELLPERLWILDRRGDLSVGSGCPSEGTKQIVRVRWTGGITKPNDEEVDDMEREQYLVSIKAENGSLEEVIPFALGNLDDNDNNHDLCLDIEGEPVSVSFPASYMTDPNGDLNPDTGSKITILP